MAGAVDISVAKETWLIHQMLFTAIQVVFLTVGRKSAQSDTFQGKS